MLMRLIALLLVATSLYAKGKDPHPLSKREAKTWSRRLIAKEVKNRDWIIDKIQAFPCENYKVVRSKKRFYHLDDLDDVVKNVVRGGDHWELHIRNLLKKKYLKPGMVVVDVGAHIGTHTLTMAEGVGRKGKVIAFEPQPKSFCELFHNVAINRCRNVELHWAALGDKNGEIELSPADPSNEAGAGCYGGTGQFVEMKTLDALQLNKVGLVKVDIEGMEGAFLKGAVETIKRCKPILIIEIMGGHPLETAAPAVKLQIKERIKMIENMGYEVKRIHSWDYVALPKGDTHV